MRMRSLGFVFLLAVALAGCGSSSTQQQAQLPPAEPPKHPEDPYHPRTETAQTQSQESVSLMGVLFSGFAGNSNSNGNGAGAAGAGVAVNSYLWHATLDTVSFMPLASADPFGGVIITDWYSPTESQVERFKLNVLILGRDLRADAVRCTVFRQKRDPSGQWVDAPVDAKTGVDLENAILTRARQMRLSTAAVTK